MTAGRRQVSTAATTASPDSKRISAAGWRIVLLASLGGSLEFYDFVIFGIFAKDIADAIFPNPTPLISLMASFAAFAAGYLARPIGGIFLSHFGDRYGRRLVFLISIFVMSGATLGMGLVPSFATWGAAASVLMVVLRAHRVGVAVGVAVLAATAGFNGLFFAHMAAYMSGVLGYSPHQAVLSQTIGVIVHALGILAVGRLANDVDPRVLLRAGSLALVALAFPFYAALAGRRPNVTLLLMLAGVSASFVNGTFAVLLTDLFPTRVRFSGVALGFNVAFTIFSGTAPLVATSLIRSTGLDTAPAFVMVGCGLLTLAGSLGLSQAGGHVLKGREDEPVREM